MAAHGGAAPGSRDRVRRACPAGARQRAAVAGLPRGAPAGAAVDDDTWRAAVSSLGLAVSSLLAACRSPDLKVHHISGKVESADACLAAVEGDVQIVLDQARPRDLPPALKRFQAALQPVLRQLGCGNGKRPRGRVAKARTISVRDLLLSRSR